MPTTAVIILSNYEKNLYFESNLAVITKIAVITDNLFNDYLKLIH